MSDLQASLGGRRGAGGSGLPSAAARLVGQWSGAVSDLVFDTALYRASLKGGAPRLIATLTDPLIGDPALGRAIIDGALMVPGQTLPIRPSLTADEASAGAHPDWLLALHGFHWLRDARAAGDQGGRAAARAILADWLRAHARWRSVSWGPDILAARVIAWLEHADFLLAEAEAELAAAMLECLAAQARHLSRLARLGAGAGETRLAVLVAVVATAHALEWDGRPDPTSRARALAALEQELRRQILPDGGHVERSPGAQVAVLRNLLVARASVIATRAPVPDFLQHALDRVAPMVRFLRHGDGGLALFNDTNEGDPAWIDRLLGEVDGRGKAQATAPHLGFHRLAAGRALVFLDAGAPAEIATHAHAGTLGFEMSVGKERLIVNCGAHAADRSEWRRAQRATAAHSTLTINDTNSSEILMDARDDAPTLGRRPTNVTAELQEADGNLWVTASHDGYKRVFGVIHQRRLFLSADGEDLRGEDTLVGDGHGRFAIRFHLHPRVQASLTQQGSGVLIRLASGGGWRLKAIGGTLSLGDSIYLGRRGEMKRAQQVIIQGDVMGPSTVVKWVLQREARKP